MRTGRWVAPAVAILTALVTGTAASSSAGTAKWTYLALGDSNVYGAPNDCGHCTTYPTLVTRHLRALGLTVTLINGAQHNKLTSGMLLHEIETNSWGSTPGSAPRSNPKGLAPRAAIAGANLITITIGNNDLPWLAATDVCHQRYDAACRGRILAEYGSHLDGALTQINKLRAGKPTAVRVTTIYNDVIQGGYTAVTTFYKPPVLRQALGAIRTLIEALNAKICQLAAQHHAKCVDDYHAFNGPHGNRPMPRGSFTAKYGDLNQSGQNTIAAAIYKVGWSPLSAP
jgi:lysophospholipase L1-like esterase